MTITDTILTPAERLQLAREKWTDDAVRDITALAVQNPFKKFTTKDFWAILDDTPGDRRAPMRAVMQRLTKSGVITPAGFTRDPGPAETQDGKVFEFNKPVIQYVSTPKKVAK